VHKYEYQANPSRLRRVMDPVDQLRVLASYEWTPEGYLDLRRDAYGLVTTFHDRTTWGAPTTITTPDGTVTSVSYDERTGQVMGTIVDALGDSPIATTTTYDSAGRPRENVGALGGVTTFDWSQDPIVATQIAGPYLHSVRRQGSSVDTTTSFEYDKNAQAVRQVNELLQLDTQYDDFGGPRRVTSTGLRHGPDVPSVQCQRNGANGRLLAAVRPEGERA